MLQRVSASMTETLPSFSLVTHAWRPFSVNTMSEGPPPVAICAETVPVRVSMTVTTFAPSFEIQISLEPARRVAHPGSRGTENDFCSLRTLRSIAAIFPLLQHAE